MSQSGYEHALRIVFPRDRMHLATVQEYRLHFHDNAKFRQAIYSVASLAAAEEARSESSEAEGGSKVPNRDFKRKLDMFRSLEQSSTDSNEEARIKEHRQETLEALSGRRPQPRCRDQEDCSSDDLEQPPTDNSEEARIKCHRQETLDILEGRRPQPQYRDWENCDWEYQVYFQQMAYTERMTARLTARREKPRQSPRSRPNDRSPDFKWQHLHKVILGQISYDDQRCFPTPDPEFVPTLLVLGSEDEFGVRPVKHKTDLTNSSVFDFRMHLLDIVRRGWQDVIWLTYPGQEAPREVHTDRTAIHMSWGGAMF